MKIVTINENYLQDVIDILRSGGLVIFPSETTYGAAVDATNATAVTRLANYKQRPMGKPYSVMVTNREMAEKYVHINKTAQVIYTNFLPGPVTVVSKGKHVLAPGIESESGTLGIRIPEYPYLLKLIARYGNPLTATSANASYKKRPYKISDIFDNLSDRQKELVDLVIDAGELPHNEPSTVIDTTMDDPIILRQGKIVLKDRNTVVTRSEEETRNTGKELWHKYGDIAGKRALIFALDGPMGAGKTQFTKGLAKAMGIDTDIISPTFNIILEYENDKTQHRLIHIDAWRLNTGSDLLELGWKELINEKSVIAMEWAERAVDSIRSCEEEAVVVWVNISYGKESNEREIKWATV